jgi:hypothetical protein
LDYLIVVWSKIEVPHHLSSNLNCLSLIRSERKKNGSPYQHKLSAKQCRDEKFHPRNFWTQFDCWKSLRRPYSTSLRFSLRDFPDFELLQSESFEFFVHFCELLLGGGQVIR